MRSLPRIAIIGCGFVGSTIAFTLLKDGLASELVLIDRHKSEADGQALDLKEGMEFLQSAKVTSGNDYSLVKGCDIIIVSAGAHQEKGESRLDLISKNKLIFKDIIPKISKYNKSAILIIVTNPVDVMTYLALKYSKYPKSRVIGSGTLLDSARLKFFLASKLNVSVSSIDAYVLGEHGDSSFPMWSHATIGDIKLEKFDHVNKSLLNEVFSKTKNAAYEIISKKGATYFAIALAVCEIVSVIANDKNKILPLSCYLDNYYGVSNVCLSVPVVLNRNGISRIIKIDFNKDELSSFKKSANIIKESISKCKD